MSKQKFVGTVVSNKMANTVVVELERHVEHPLYKKLIKKTTKLSADTKGQKIEIGTVVEIEQTRPISKTKQFVVSKTF